MSGRSLDNLRAKQQPPFEPGNGVARTHSLHALRSLSEEERAEIDELADALLALSPVADEFGHERLRPVAWSAALQARRIRLAHDYITSNGITKSQSLLAHLASTERAFLGSLAALALTPAAAADVGLSLAQIARLESGRTVDLERLAPAERLELERLLQKARTEPKAVTT